MSGRLILAIRDWVQSVVEPFLAWMPSWLVPYVVDAGGIVLLVAMLFGMWRFTVYLWTASFLAPRRLGRRIGAHKKSRNTVARRVRMNTPGVIENATKTNVFVHLPRKPAPGGFPPSGSDTHVEGGPDLLYCFRNAPGSS